MLNQLDVDQKPHDFLSNVAMTDIIDLINVSVGNLHVGNYKISIFSPISIKLWK
jgi:hypothetical protein